MNHFGIYSPVFGINKTIPHVFLHKAYTPDCSNVQLWDGEVRSSKMRCVELLNASGNTVQSPDTNPFLKYMNVLASSGEKYLLGFTKNHIYHWKTTTKAWDELWAASGTTTTSWSTAVYNGTVIATDNNAGNILKWSSGVDSDFSAYTPAVASGVTINRAKAVITFENHIVFGNYATSDGNGYYNGIVWSDLDTGTADSVYTSMPTFILDGLTDAGASYVQGTGFIQSMGVKGDYLYVFKDTSIRAYWYTGTSLIFYSKSLSESVGCTAIDSIINDSMGGLYYYASDLTFREIESGVISGPIDSIVRSINQGLLVGIKSAFVTEYGELWWSVPSDGNSTENDKTYCFKNGIWTIRDYGVTAFGQWERTGTLDWSDLAVYAGWNEWAWDNWLDPQASAGFPIDICSDASGITYQCHGANTDLGAEFTSYFVMTTDLGDGSMLRQYKRLLNLLLYVYSSGQGTLSIYIKQDNEATWQSAGSVSLDSTAEISIPELPVDFRAKTFLIKIESTVPFRFIGMELDSLASGIR